MATSLTNFGDARRGAMYDYRGPFSGGNHMLTDFSPLGTKSMYSTSRHDIIVRNETNGEFAANVWVDVPMNERFVVGPNETKTANVPNSSIINISVDIDGIHVYGLSQVANNVGEFKITNDMMRARLSHVAVVQNSTDKLYCDIFVEASLQGTDKRTIQILPNYRRRIPVGLQDEYQTFAYLVRGGQIVEKVNLKTMRSYIVDDNYVNNNPMIIHVAVARVPPGAQEFALHQGRRYYSGGN